MGAVTSVTEVAWQDLLAFGRADGLIPELGNWDSMACLRRSSAGWMPAMMERLSNGVGRRYPVITRSASLIAVSMMRVCTLRHQTGAQYSTVEYTRARAAVWRTAPLAPHPDPASHLIRAMSDVSFPRSDSRCRWYVSDLSSFSPRYVCIWVKGRHFPSSEMLSLHPASLLYRWKAADTVFDQLSFSHQVWRYAASVTRSWLRTPSTACQNA